MIKYLRAACIALAAFVYSTLAMAQAPCQWNYSFVNNVATANYCGAVTFASISVPLASITGMDATARTDLANPSDATGGMSTYNGLQTQLALYATLANLSSYAPLASPALTGSPTTPTQPTADNTTKIASDAFVQNVVANYAPIASPTFTGSPAAPTQPPGDNTTKLATDAFVINAVSSLGSTPPAWAITGGLPSSMTGTNTSASMSISAVTATDASDQATIGWVGSKAWAVSNGNAANGYSGGTTLPNSSTIHVYDCHGTSGDASYAIPNSGYPLTAASCPTGYQSYVRRLFSFTTTAAGAPVPYVADEVEGGSLLAYLATQTLDASGTALGNSSRTLISLNAPLGIKLRWIGRFVSNGSAIVVICTSPDQADVAPASVITSVPGGDSTSTGTVFMVVAMQYITNTSAQIACRGSTGSAPLYLDTAGFTDFRRS